MDLRQLRYFLAIADHYSFSEAAKVLGITQQALSKSIAALENDLGVRLFDRDTRNVTLTKYGEMLRAHARNATAELQQFRRLLDDALGLNTGRLIIGAGITSATQIVPVVVAALLRKRPKLQVSVVEGTAASLLPKLLRGDVDVCLCVFSQPPEDPMLRHEFLLKEKVRLVARVGHPLAKLNRVKLEDTIKYPWVVWGSGGLEPYLSQPFEKQGIKPPKPNLLTTSVVFAKELLCRSDSVAVISDQLIKHEVDLGLLRVIDLDADLSSWEGPMTICYRSNSIRSPVTMAFVAELRSVAEEFEQSGII